MDYENGFEDLLELDDTLGLYEADYLSGGGQPTYAPPVSRTSATYIRWVQQSLNRLIGAGLAVDGVNGPKTRAAVRTFQSRMGLAVDGIVGPQTEAALVRAGAPAPPTGGQPGGGPAPGPQPGPQPQPPAGQPSLAALGTFSRWLLQDYMARRINLDCADLAIELWCHFGERYGVPVSFEFWDAANRRYLVASRSGVRPKLSNTVLRRFSSLNDFIRYVQGNVGARGLIPNTVPVAGQHRAAVSGDVFLWEYKHKQTGQMNSMGHTQIFYDVTPSSSGSQYDTIRVVQGNYPAIPPEFRTNTAGYFYSPHDSNLSSGPHTALPALPAPRRFRSFEHLR